MKNDTSFHNSDRTKLLVSVLSLSVIAAFIILALCIKPASPNYYDQHNSEQCISFNSFTTSFVHVNNKPKSNICVLVESGHSKIHNNTYLTQGKQSPEWPCGLKIYEGYSCGILAHELVSSLQQADIDAFVLNSEAYDYSNITRAERVNKWFGLDSRIVFISLHHNAQTTDKADYTDQYGLKGYINGGATGIEIFTSIGKTKSDTIAAYIYTELFNEFPELRFRCDWSDGDADKEANFTVLASSYSPAVLIELLFMTTYSDCKLIANKNIRDRYIQAITRALVIYNNNKTLIQ